MASITVNNHASDPVVRRRLWGATIAAFSCAAAFSALLLSSLWQHDVMQLRAKASNIAQAHLRSLGGSIDHALSATYALAAALREGNGTIRDFDRLATEMLGLYPGVGALQLAPGGVIRKAVPLAGNERAIGHELLKDPARNKEAFLARDTGKLTLAGPFNLVQGGLGAAGRLPIFLPHPSGGTRFWGFTIALIRFPDVLNAAGLHDLVKSGYHYELWRVHPDTGRKQVIAASTSTPLDSPVEVPLEVPNGRWILGVAPAAGWVASSHRAGGVALALVLSAGVALVVHILLRQPILLRRVVDERTRELVESVERVRLLLDSTAEAIYGIDSSGRCTFVNRSTLRMLRYGAETDLLGKNMHQLVHHTAADGSTTPDGLGGISRAFLAGEKVHCDSEVLWRSDGTYFPAEYWSFPVRDADDIIIGAVVTFLDISERVAHRRREDEFDKVFQILPDQFYHLDKEGTILDFRARGGRGAGCPSGEIVGRRMHDFLPMDATEALSVALRRVAVDGVLEQIEYVMGMPDGEQWFEMRIAPLYDAEELIAVVRDITEVKRLEAHRLEMERRLLHSQKLESLGVLAGGIAHDFNNLLAAILGNLDLAVLRLPSGTQAREGIERSMLACRKAADLTRQMLAYSGKSVFELKVVDLNSIIRENSDLFRTVVPRTVSLKVESAQDLPAVLVDPSQIQQVVMNLITNAAEAIGASPGIISLTTGTMECDEECTGRSCLDDSPPPGTYVFLEVADNGCGMDRETQRRLFEPFFTTKFAGRGLGMAATQGIVKAHKGIILLDSAPQKGSTFRILFPAGNELTLAPAGGDVPDLSPSSSARHVMMRALIIDDDDMVRTIGCEYLRLLGWDPLEARDGLDALEVFRRHVDEISIVILDLTMPNMDGVTTFYELKKIRPEVAIILSSGYSEESAAEKFHGEAPDGFLQKPFQLGQVRQRLQPFMERAMSQTR